MATKVRLQRHGKKGYPVYHIVVADSRAPRDGRFIERLGLYNPNTNPATIDLDVDKSVKWMLSGAQPSDTAKAILSYKGVLYKAHLQTGVNKGAITQEQADATFATWAAEKDAKISNKKTTLATTKSKVKSARLAEETKLAQARAEAIASKLAAANAPAAEETTEAEAPAETGSESTEA